MFLPPVTSQNDLCFITVRLANEPFAVRLDHVVEVLAWPNILPAREFSCRPELAFAGDLAFTLLDLRVAHDLPRIASESCVVLATARSLRGGKGPVGLAVDRVTDAFVVSADHIEDPDLIDAFRPGLRVRGYVRVDGMRRPLLDIEHLFDHIASSGQWDHPGPQSN